MDECDGCKELREDFAALRQEFTALRQESADNAELAARELIKWRQLNQRYLECYQVVSKTVATCYANLYSNLRKIASSDFSDFPDFTDIPDFPGDFPDLC